MNTEVELQGTHLVPSLQKAQNLISHTLIKRGLDDLERDTLTAEEVIAARRENDCLKGLSDAVLHIVVRKPPSWEHRLFLQALIDEIDGYESLRQVRALGYMPVVSEIVEATQIHSWCKACFEEQMQLGAECAKLINHDLQEGIGAPGQPGDASAIVMVARKLGIVYKSFLEFSIRCTRIQHDPRLDGVFEEMSKIDDGIIKEFEEFPRSALLSLIDAIAAHTGGKKILPLSMKFAMNTDTLLLEIEKSSKVIFGTP